MKSSVNLKLITSFLLTCVIFSSISTSHSIKKEHSNISNYWPTNGWLTAYPEEVNVSTTKLASFVDHIEENNLPIDSIFIVRNGYLILEKYYNNYTEIIPHAMFSVTKSFISTLIGIAIDEGYLSLDQKMVDFFQNRTIENLDAQKEAITIEHLLTMTSGLQWSEPINDAFWTSSDNFVQYVLDRPMSDPPGSVFNYNSGSTHILSAILTNATGMSTFVFAEEKLFAPLGFSNYSWDQDPQGIHIGGYGLYLTPKDMAKLGYLYLNNGTWDNSQIISKSWVVNATTKKIDAWRNANYGYLWWLYPQIPLYGAEGFLGQKIFVISDYDLVVVFTADTIETQLPNQLLEEYLLPCLNDYPVTTTSESSFPLLSLLFIIPIILFKKRRKKKKGN